MYLTLEDRPTTNTLQENFLESLWSDTKNIFTEKVDKTTNTLDQTNQTVKQLLKQTNDFMAIAKPAFAFAGILLTTLIISEIWVNIKEIRKK